MQTWPTRTEFQIDRILNRILNINFICWHVVIGPGVNSSSRAKWFTVYRYLQKKTSVNNSNLLRGKAWGSRVTENPWWGWIGLPYGGKNSSLTKTLCPLSTCKAEEGLPCFYIIVPRPVALLAVENIVYLAASLFLVPSTVSGSRIAGDRSGRGKARKICTLWKIW